MEEPSNRILDAPANPNPDPASNAPNNNENDNDDSEGLLTELLYCISSYHAIVTPVSITMILSALAVVYINTDETRAQGEAAFSQTYNVIDLEEGNSTQNFAASVANVLIIVSVICAMTFVIVALYKYGCMKIFYGYMVAVTAMLLGYFTSNMALVAIQKYEIRADKVSFAYIIWNYAVVGVMAIFFNAGIPKFVTQGYLVTSSVTLAWQLSYFDDWTAWTLLVMLALYDLFAVLSPCGPLKALTKLLSKPGARPLPGLLYEATLPTGVRRPNRAASATNNNASNEDNTQQTRSDSSNHQDSTTAAPESSTTEQSSSAFINERLPDDEASSSMALQTPNPPESNNRSEQLLRHRSVLGPSVRSTQFFIAPNDENGQQRDGQTGASSESVEISLPVQQQEQEPLEDRKGKIALAIAKLYKLPVIDEDGVLRRRRWRSQRNVPYHSPEYSWEEIREIEWTPQQLRTEVTVIFPERGGRIIPATRQDSNEGKKYVVYNRSNELLRTFVVNRQGTVMQVVRRTETDESASKENNTIKLGLGDFIFYSVLVSKAALYSFPCFASCMLTILFGLGATLVLLSVHGKALPALPISIFLAVLTFVMMRYLTEPYFQDILRYSLYV